MAGRASSCGKKSLLECAAPEGACDFEELTVSLKRYPDTKPQLFLRLLWRQGCTFISIVGGARLQSASHPSSGLACFEVKWCSAIVFNGLQVGRGLAFGRRIAPSQCSIDSAVGFHTRRSKIRLLAPLFFRRLPASPSK